MPHGQWVAFDVATDDQHICSKKIEKIQKKSVSKKLSKEIDYGGLSLEESSNSLNDYDSMSKMTIILMKKKFKN